MLPCRLMGGRRSVGPAAAPLGAGGLLVMVAGAVGARLFWSGVVTLRAGGLSNVSGPARAQRGA